MSKIRRGLEVGTAALLTVVWFGAQPNNPSYDSLPAFNRAKEYAVRTGAAITVPSAEFYHQSGGFELDSDNLQYVCLNGEATIYQTTRGMYGVLISANYCLVKGLRHVATQDKEPRFSNSIANRWKGEFLRAKCSAIVVTGEYNVCEDVSDYNFVAGWRAMGGRTRIWEPATFGATMTVNELQLNESERREDGYYVDMLLKVFGTGGPSPTPFFFRILSYDGTTNKIGYATLDFVPAGTVYYFILSGQSDGNVLRNHTTDRVDFGIIASFLDRVYFEGDLVALYVERTQNAQPHHVYLAGSVDPVDTEVPADEDVDCPAANYIYCSGAFRCQYAPDWMAYKFRNFKTFYGQSFVSEGARGCLVLQLGQDAFLETCIARNANSLGDSPNPPVALELYDVKRSEVVSATLTVSPDFDQSNNQQIPRVVSVISSNLNSTPEHVLIRSLWGEFDGTVTAQYGVASPDGTGLPSTGYLQVDRMTLISRNATLITLARLFYVTRAMIGPMIKTSGAAAAIVLEETAPNVTLDYDGSEIEGGTVAVTDNATSAEARATACTISGTTLTVGGTLTNSKWRANMVVSGVGVTVGSSIVQQLTGTTGGAGTYELSTSSTVASPVAMTGAVVADNRVTNRLTAGTSNLLLNPSFLDWTAGTSFALLANTVTDVADEWVAWRDSAAAATVLQVAGTGSQFFLRTQRTAATTGATSIFVVQVIPSELVMQLAGGTLTHSFYGRAGENWSGSLLRTSLYWGTVYGETISSTGFTGGGRTTNQNVALTTAGSLLTVRHSVPQTALSLAISHEFNPVGLAGANDYFDLGLVGMYAGSVGKPFKSFMMRI